MLTNLPLLGMSQHSHAQQGRFTGTMHPDSTIFKNHSAKGSLAHQGILRKDPSKMHKESLGMNPNVRVEDSYSENLLKQIHFMNLEINLLKQKQEENKDVMGIQMLMQKDKNAHIDHIIEANKKFMTLLQEQIREKTILENQVLRDKERNEDLRVIRDLAVKKHSDTSDKFGRLNQTSSKAIKDLQTKFDQDHNNRMELLRQVQKLENNTNEAKKKNEELNKYLSEKNLNDEIQKGIEEEDLKILRDANAFKDQIIEELTAKRDEKLRDIDQDNQLKDLKAKNIQQSILLREKENELSDIHYKVFEMEHLQELAIKMKEQESETRRGMMEDYDRLKSILEETEKANRLKVEKKIRDNQSEQLGKLEGVLRKEQGELNEIKVRYDRIHKEFKNYKLDQLRKSNYLNKLLAENKEKEDLYNGHMSDIKDLDPKVDELKLKVEDLEMKIKDLKEQEKTLLGRVFALEEEHSSLGSRVNFIAQNFNLNEDLRKVNLEELKSVMNANLSVNSTITELLNKWDGIQRFGKGHMPSENIPQEEEENT